MIFRVRHHSSSSSNLGAEGTLAPPNLGLPHGAFTHIGAREDGTVLPVPISVKNGYP